MGPVLDRSERYKRRAQEAGDVLEEDDCVLPGFTDPITLEQVVNPGISPYGAICLPNGEFKCALSAFYPSANCWQFSVPILIKFTPVCFVFEIVFICCFCDDWSVCGIILTGIVVY